MAQETLQPDEIRITIMALTQVIDDNESVAKNPAIPLDPQTRKHLKEMLTAAKSAKGKLERTVGYEVKLDPYVEGDEQEFLTKES